MPTPEPDFGSVSLWINAIKAGDLEAAQPLWERYFARLVGLARARLARHRGRPTIEDEEDAALSALDTFIQRAAGGQFPNLRDRDGLWRLLVTITVRKVADQRDRSARRPAITTTDLTAGSDSPGEPWEEASDSDPTPALAAEMAEQLDRLLRRLPTDRHRRVAVMRMDSYTKQEIADAIGCDVKTVYNIIQLIKKYLEADAR
jgi:DNA-directed RNA polymerase specialized sigma24 family protein